MSAELDCFLKPGSVAVSDVALNLARRFGEATVGAQKGKWIVAFSWYKSMTIQDPAKGTTERLGPGIDIGAFRLSDVPARAIWEKDGFRFAIQIPDFVVAEAKQKLIDVNPNPPPNVQLL
jgi:hypothetical protein